MLRIARSYWKSALSIVIIVYLSFAPPSDFREIPRVSFIYFDKIVHIILYTFLTIVLVADFRDQNHFNNNKIKCFVQCVLFPIIMGGCIEIAQDKWFYPRTAEWIDWVADILGVAIGLLIMRLYKKTYLKT